MLQRAFFFPHALLPEGWAENVRVDITDGIIAAVTPNQTDGEAETIDGVAVPGLPNLHSHAFQRGMAGLAERRGPANDTFWTWREVMYRFLERLTPDDVEAIAAFAYMEMLEAGFTAVGEFHYLHHDIDGRPYADIAEMAGRIIAASRDAGIGLTLLPTFYAHGGFGGADPLPSQRRFVNEPDRFFKLLARIRDLVGSDSAIRAGIAAHSLRAVTPDELRRVFDAAPEGPIHIHAAEQMKEVEDSVARLGRAPVGWLLENMPLGPRWCIIHATHMTGDETRGLAGCGAVAGLCPITEASLGDGIFNGVAYMAHGGRFGIGTDSNIQIDAAAELRQLEYSQRLKHQVRNALTSVEGESTGRRLFSSALAGGTQALAQNIGGLAPGRRANIVVLDSSQVDMVGRGDAWLDRWLFVAGKSVIRTVLAMGERLVEDGRHVRRERIERRYRNTIARLAAL